MMTLLQAAVWAARPWADLYADSTVVKASVAFLHVGGLMAAGGFALAADRATLRMCGRPDAERRAWVRELASIHRPVVAGLAVVVFSGLLMLAADIEALFPSPLFWVKMAGFILLLLNGRALQRAGGRLATAMGAAAESDEAGEIVEAGDGAADHAESWKMLRAASLRSGGLWFVVLFLGTLLTAAA
ncbi:MAG TPA: hypothetical protein VFJ16_19265 [Longimicrobium sp.]|nr:hypothetical protein [Longimicrobium sp.]